MLKFVWYRVLEKNIITIISLFSNFNAPTFSPPAVERISTVFLPYGIFLFSINEQMNCTLVLMNTFPLLIATPSAPQASDKRSSGEISKKPYSTLKRGPTPILLQISTIPWENSRVTGWEEAIRKVGFNSKHFSVTSLHPKYTAHHRWYWEMEGRQQQQQQPNSQVKCNGHKKENFIFTSSLLRIRVPLREGRPQNFRHSLANASETTMVTCLIAWLEVLFQPCLED